MNTFAKKHHLWCCVDKKGEKLLHKGPFFKREVLSAIFTIGQNVYRLILNLCHSHCNAGFLLFSSTLHLELRSVTCNGAEEDQAHRCDPYGLRVQEQPLFLVYSRIVFLLLWIKSHRSKNIYAGADQK